MDDGAARLIVLRGNSASGKSTTAMTLRRLYPGRSVWISFEETLRRHASRQLACAFGGEEMAAWYRPDDRLTGVREHVIGESDDAHRIIDRIRAATGLPKP